MQTAPPVGVGTWEAPFPGSSPAPGRPATSPRGQGCARRERARASERGGAVPVWDAARCGDGDVAAPGAPESSLEAPLDAAREEAGEP